MSSIITADKLSYVYEQRDDTDAGSADAPGSESPEGAETGRRTALDGLDIKIEEGSFTAVLGANGSGKSTFAKCVNALLLPTSGRMTVAGMDTSDEKYVWDIRSTAGMVFQNPDNQIVSSIVEDDVAFGPENLGVPTDEIRERIDRAMKDVGIYELRKRSPNTLSGGQKQRVAIAGVLAMEPRCVIFDESTAMLDPGGRKDVMDIIKKLNSRGITIILITHYMEEAEEADRIVIMHDGRAIADGEPAAIFARHDLIEEAGLELPYAVKTADILRENGVPVPAEVITMEKLAAWLTAYGGRSDAD